MATVSTDILFTDKLVFSMPVVGILAWISELDFPRVISNYKRDIEILQSGGKTDKDREWLSLFRDAAARKDYLKQLNESLPQWQADQATLWKIGVVRNVLTVALLIAGLATGFFAVTAVALFGGAHAILGAKIVAGLAIGLCSISALNYIRNLWINRDQA